MEIISILVVLSIVACVIFIGMATVRLIQVEDQTGRRQKVKQTFDAPSNDVVFENPPRSAVATIRPLKIKG
ncbi:MAG: hypothetical protein RLZZ627_1990 [Pseudomonadota bacterium]|jgi:hypothetical protein